MLQILFTIPIPEWLQAIQPWDPVKSIPIHGYGVMLFFAYIACTAMARRLCKWQGFDGAFIPDLAIWLFVTGISGGRTVYVIQYWHTFDHRPLGDIFKLWDGGLVLYGSLMGGMLGYFAFHWFILRKRGISFWKMCDVVAPCLVIGIALGRIGCLCTGCCYGNVACESCPAIHFPLMTNTSSPSVTPAAGKMIEMGYQTSLGFLFKEDSLEVTAVEPGSAAEAAGLRVNDKIITANGKAPEARKDFDPIDGTLKLTVDRAGQRFDIAFAPTSIGVHPTQIYETISMCFLLFFMLSYFPYRRREGELMVIFMFAYGIHRFLNEMLRTDTDPVAFGLTLSQNISILVLAAGVILAWFVWRRPPIGTAPPSVPLSELPTEPITSA